MPRADLIKRANDLNNRLGLLMPDWTSAEQAVLSKVSGVGYKLAAEAKKKLTAELAFLQRNAQDPEAKQRLKSLLQTAQQAEAALNQVGYSARRAYDIRW